MAKDKKTPSDVSKMIKDREVKLVDFKFADLPGTWQHFTTTLAEKADAYLKSTGIADTAFFGPEAEFFIFDDVRFSYGANSSFHCLESGEGHWNSAREEFPNLGYKIRAKEGYFPVAPADTLQD